MQVSGAAQPAPKAKKASGSSGEAACQQLQLRHDILRGLHAVYELLFRGSVLSVAHDVRATEQIIRSTAVRALSQASQLSNKSSKLVEAALQRSCTGQKIAAVGCLSRLALCALKPVLLVRA